MLAKLFSRDPMNLRAPDVQKAPTKTFFLSDSKLTFRCPPMTAMIPGYSNGDSFDFERDTKEQIGNNHNRFLQFFRTGWDFEDAWWRPMSYGSVRMGVFMSHNNQFDNPEISLFKKENLINHSLQLALNAFVRSSASIAQIEDHQITEEDIETKKHYALHYPETPDEVQLLPFSGTTWIAYETYFPGQPPELCFQTAVGHNHLVRFLFSQDAHGGIDYFSPNHNLKETCHRLINEIMSTVTLELSPEAQKQKEAVIELYGPDQVV